MGAGQAQAQPPRPESVPANPCSRAVGGQADLRFFGVGDFQPTNRGDQGKGESRALASVGKTSPPQAPRYDTARRVNGQTFSQRRARFTSYAGFTSPKPAASATAPQPVVPAPIAAPTPAPKPLRVPVPADCFKSLARIADNKLVGLDELVAHLLIRCVKRINERESAMRANAAAADERERFIPEPLEEWGRPVLFGHTEIELAMVG